MGIEKSLRSSINSNNKGEGMVSVLIGLGLLGVFISFTLSIIQSGYVQDSDMKNTAGIISKFKEIQITLGPRNNACSQNFYGITFPNTATSLQPLTQLNYKLSTPPIPTPVLVGMNHTFEDGIKTSKIQLVDLTKVTDDAYTANLLIEFTKPSGKYVGPEKISRKIPIYLWVTNVGASGDKKIFDCATAPDVSQSVKMAFCLSSMRSVPATWDSVSQNCLLPIDGRCGSANGTTQSSAPSGASLCSAGIASLVSGTGPWSWSCSGLNGGLTDFCSAQTNVVHGSCGSANGTATATPPLISSRCNTGVASSLSGSGPWSWNCIGLNGGNTVSCSTSSAAVNGQCGSANGTNPPTAPSGPSLCNVGSVSSFSGSGPWNWNCDGSNGGTAASCSTNASPSAGVCGSDNGKTFTSPPGADLCSSGTVSGFGGGGPWDWTCLGTNGGSDVACHASYYQCESQSAGEVSHNTTLINWVDKPTNNTGAWAFCMAGSIYEDASDCSGVLMSSTQCDIPHSQNNNKNLKNGAYVQCCRTLP